MKSDAKNFCILKRREIPNVLAYDHKKMFEDYYKKADTLP